MRLELEPEEEARRKAIEASWDAEEKLKRIQGASVRALCESFQLAAEAAGRREKQKRKAQARRRARARQKAG